MNPLESFFNLDDFIWANFLAVVLLIILFFKFHLFLFELFLFFVCFSFYWYFAEKSRIKRFKEMPLNKI